MSRSTRTNLVLGAISRALDSLSVLPDSEQARRLREECLACQAAAKEWETTSPSAEERETMMRRAVALHVAITKMGRG